MVGVGRRGDAQHAVSGRALVNAIVEPLRLTAWQPPHVSGLLLVPGTMKGCAARRPKSARIVPEIFCSTSSRSRPARPRARTRSSSRRRRDDAGTHRIGGGDVDRQRLAVRGRRVSIQAPGGMWYTHSEATGVGACWQLTKNSNASLLMRRSRIL
jgi:hypothetical protein